MEEIFKYGYLGNVIKGSFDIDQSLADIEFDTYEGWEMRWFNNMKFISLNSKNFLNFISKSVKKHSLIESDLSETKINFSIVACALVNYFTQREDIESEKLLDFFPCELILSSRHSIIFEPENSMIRNKFTSFHMDYVTSDLIFSDEKLKSVLFSNKEKPKNFNGLIKRLTYLKVRCKNYYDILKVKFVSTGEEIFLNNKDFTLCNQLYLLEPESSYIPEILKGIKLSETDSFMWFLAKYQEIAAFLLGLPVLDGSFSEKTLRIKLLEYSEKGQEKFFSDYSEKVKNFISVSLDGFPCNNNICSETGGFTDLSLEQEVINFHKDFLIFCAVHSVYNIFTTFEFNDLMLKKKNPYNNENLDLNILSLVSVKNIFICKLESSLKQHLGKPVSLRGTMKENMNNVISVIEEGKFRELPLDIFSIVREMSPEFLSNFVNNPQTSIREYLSQLVPGGEIHGTLIDSEGTVLDLPINSGDFSNLFNYFVNMFNGGSRNDSLD